MPQLEVYEKTDLGSEFEIVDVKKILKDKLHYFFNSSFPSNGEILRIQIRIKKIDPLHWLYWQRSPTKIYWLNRERNFEMAGIGEAIAIIGEGQVEGTTLFNNLKRGLSNEFKDLRYYGGMRFNPTVNPDEYWQKFGSYRFVIPRFEIVHKSGETYLACNFSPSPSTSDEILRQLYHICFNNDLITGDIPPVLSRKDIPDYTKWHNNISYAMEVFSRGEVQKIVLTRKTIFEFSQTLDPLLLLKRLKPAHPESFHFCFQIDNKTSFIGASPELLYRRTDKQIASDAIAGTCPRGNSLTEDQELSLRLLRSKKDRQEHQFVIEWIKNAFDTLCRSTYVQGGTRILKLANVQHLHNHFQGIVADGVSDAEILTTLHPTPAVGGYPKERALAEIEKLESFDRGWYAAPVGWVGTDEAEFAVAIRSGLILDHRLSLFSGAGIIPASTPEAEWREMENKLANFITIIQ
ncbi:MAG: isochorismate synthase [bacterium]